MASPVDPRLLRLVPPVRQLIVRTGVAQAADTLLLVARGILIGVVAASAVTERAVPRASLLLALAGVVVAHGVLSWVAQRWSADAVGGVVEDLRTKALRALAKQDPRAVEQDSATWRHVLTRGITDFRPYLTEFLPALFSTAIGTPIVVAVIFYFDWLSGVFCLITLPLIPAFMVLIGKLTADHTQRRLEVTAGLGAQLSDLLAGAPTLRALHATQRPAQQIRQTGRKHADSTMGVLRLAFLSSFALEFIATLSVALVAVSIGLRLVTGSITLLAGLTVLIIVPEVFAPIRRVGASYHAAADGLSAAERVLELLDAPSATTGSYISDSDGVRVRNLSVRGRDGIRPDGLTFDAPHGQITVLTGANGSGKSTTLLAVLGQLPDEMVGGEVGVEKKVAYLPATPAMEPGTVGSNVALFGAHGDADLVGVSEAHAVGPYGDGISAGQRQRVGIARAFAADADVYVLDEPTAHLSPELVEEVIRRMRELARRGAAVLVVSHDQRVLDAADQVVQV
ncbi:ABC transporter [Corynebacterium sp. NML140438]|uniref:ABC transporter ATP-binding protein/permease n=1 Tax=Corynebacterium sp. NML140438 TaxID=1906334 RepID=UPI0008FAFDAC|nr:ABC transporter transmembrane domain-containing protein [Corynebacterium sp. NML140438]OIR41787.1 ABC transporter [Corynebacterium sp. NML140438]